MDGYAVDEASQRAMNQFAPLSAIILFCVCLLCLDSLAATLLVFGISVISQAVTLAILHYCGGTMTALLILLPPLVQVLAIAGGIHMINYFFDAASTADGPEAVAEAFRRGWLPCVLSATTTAIGLGSLWASGLVAVREFGAYAAVGVIATVVLLLILLPGIITLRPITVPASARRQLRSNSWMGFTRWQSRHGSWISAAAVALMIGLGFGVARLQASVRIETLFDKDSRLLRDYAWLEKHIGSLVPIEVVTHFDNESPLSAVERMQLLREIEQRLDRQPQVNAVTSCLDFLPRLRDPSDNAITSTLIASDRFASQLLPQCKPIVEAANYLVVGSDGAESCAHNSPRQRPWH